MEIDTTGWAPTRAAAVAFFEAAQIATTDEDGNITPIASCNIHPFRPNEELTVTKPTGQIIEDEFGNEVPEMTTVAGWHFNIRFHSDSAATLTQGLAQTDENGDLLGLFERTHILDLVAARTGASPTWDAVTVGGVPAGYAMSAPGQPYDGVRCYDPATLSSPSNVWA